MFKLSDEQRQNISEYFGNAVGSEAFGRNALKWGQAVGELTASMQWPVDEFPNAVFYKNLPEPAQAYVERRMGDELSLASMVVSAAGLLVSDSDGNKCTPETVELRLQRFVHQLEMMVEIAQERGVIVKVTPPN